MKRLSLVALVFCLPLLLEPHFAGQAQSRVEKNPEQIQTASEQSLPPHNPLKAGKKVKVVKKINGIATGYYGPRKNQARYATGNYRKEVRLNGSGEYTAIGVKPRLGTISANFRRFPPGTILRIKDLATGHQVIGVVEDTGDAMKRNSRHIDIYMGEGERGLDKSVAWGKRKVVIEQVRLV
jgi:3D (Asp-Asp-Asp) domain-containing protein